MAQPWSAAYPSDLGHGSGNFEEKSSVTLERRGGQATQKSTEMGKNVARKREYIEEEERMERHAKETRMPQRSKVSSRVEEGEFTGKCCFSHPETVKWSTGFICRQLAGAEMEQIHKTAWGSGSVNPLSPKAWLSACSLRLCGISCLFWLMTSEPTFLEVLCPRAFRGEYWAGREG